MATPPMARIGRLRTTSDADGELPLTLLGLAGMQRSDVRWPHQRMLRIAATPMLPAGLRAEALHVVRNASFPWRRRRHRKYPTTDSDLFALPSLEEPIARLLDSRILPALARLYHVDVADLWVHDIFLVKYDAEGQAQLRRHRDASCFSFIAQLNEPSEFEGGGTAYFLTPQMRREAVRSGRASEGWVSVAAGDALVFSGRRLHEGRLVTRGQRFILAGFVDLFGPDGNAAISNASRGVLDSTCPFPTGLTPSGLHSLHTVHRFERAARAMLGGGAGNGGGARGMLPRGRDVLWLLAEDDRLARAALPRHAPAAAATWLRDIARAWRAPSLLHEKNASRLLAAVPAAAVRFFAQVMRNEPTASWPASLTSQGLWELVSDTITNEL